MTVAAPLTRKGADMIATEYSLVSWSACPVCTCEFAFISTLTGRWCCESCKHERDDLLLLGTGQVFDDQASVPAPVEIQKPVIALPAATIIPFPRARLRSVYLARVEN